MLETPEGSDLSLADLNASVTVPAGASRFRRWLGFAGPGYIIAVGYMDPGNWATDIAAGSAYGYRLLATVLLASLMAMVLQSLCAWLGIAAGRDLAQLTRAAVSPGTSFILWLFAQSSIIACDIAEVIGGAIALNLLFGLPILVGALLTIADAFVILFLLRRGVRLLEAAVIGVCTLIAAALLLEIVLAHPAVAPIFAGLVPHRDLITILIMAASIFHAHGQNAVQDLAGAYRLISPILGSHLAPIIFGLALLGSSLNATVTGTLAGQVVMEGMIRVRLPATARRLVTRGVAVIPVVVVLAIAGTGSVNALLVASQVVLSLQLPFAMLPLMLFAGSATRLRGLLPPLWLRVSGWAVTAAILLFNTALLRSLL